MSIINCKQDLFGDIMIKKGKIFILALIALLSFSIASVSAIDVYLGETVELGGSCTSDYVYLFVTGPNLPSNGANPDNIYEAVVSGDDSTFVTVSAFNNRWSYKWDTRTSDGNPDAGVYTFYASERPVGRNDLSGVEYSSKTVRLLDPSISVSGVSSSENPEYYISSGTQAETESPTVSATKVVTSVPTTARVTEMVTATATATPAAGFPPVLLILSVVLSVFLVALRKERS